MTPNDSERLIYDEEYWPPASHPLRLVGALALLVVAAFVCLGWFAGAVGIAGGASGENSQVEVPKVTGRTEVQAVERLTDAGFEVDVIPTRNAIVPEGIVFAQDPRGGLTASPGQTVRVRVSAGDSFVVVPELRGTHVDRLSGQLLGFGLAVGDVTREPHDASLEGEIIRQSPQPGAEVPVGTPISVVVSEGPPPVVVPDVSGMSEDEATLTLGRAGFQVSSQRRYSRYVPVGQVISTSPRAGEEIAYGSPVRLYVSGGTPPTTNPPTTQPPTTEPPSTSPTTSPPTTNPPTTQPPTTNPPTTNPPTTQPPTTEPPAPEGDGGGGAEGGAAGASTSEGGGDDG